MKHLLPFLITILPVIGLAQRDSLNPYVQNLAFIKKHSTKGWGDKDYQPGRKNFYLYRNCVYHLKLAGGKELLAKIVDVRNYRVYYVEYRPQQTCAARRDTIALYADSIRKIRLETSRRGYGLSGLSLRRHRSQFYYDTAAKAFPVDIDTTFMHDSTTARIYENVPYLTRDGRSSYFQLCSVYYPRGIAAAENYKTAKALKTLQVRSGAWITPSNANVINGLTLGLMTIHWKGQPLTINGVNVNADPASAIFLMYFIFLLGAGNSLVAMDDTVATGDIEIFVKGLSISGGGLLGDLQAKGVSINGLLTKAIDVRGVSITGVGNYTDMFRGVVLTGGKNRAIVGRGLQISLWNICKDLKGVQIGLWNVNSKRKLPFINWSF